MREQKLLRIVDQQNEINIIHIRGNFRKVMEEEFIMNQVFLRYLDYLEKCSEEEWKTLQLNDVINKCIAPVKKVKDFDISKHIYGSTYMHRHTYLELDYVYQGSCSYSIGNEDRTFELKEKELCIINQNVLHAIDTKSSEDIIFKCMIPFEYLVPEQFSEISSKAYLKKFFEHALQDNYTKASYLVYRIRDTEYVEELMYRLFREYLGKERGWRQMIKNSLSSLFLLLIRIGDEDLLTVRELEEENLNITKVLECIRKNYQYITLQDIAKDLHFHENYLSRMIKEHTNQNFREILSQIRLKEAEKLLKITELSVTEISLQVGYHKPNFFYKIFKEHYGMTPIDYRSTHRNG